MIAGVWGKKVGMTQLFVKKVVRESQGGKKGAEEVVYKDVVVPVTAIDVRGWIVVGYKIGERDGYDAIKVACPRDRYLSAPFSAEWLKKSKHYFLFVREVKISGCDGLTEQQFHEQMKTRGLIVGAPFVGVNDLPEGLTVDVFGTTKGAGFAGVVRRHGFTGARASHGAAMGKRPGSMGGARMQGKILKGKRLPGHMGVNKRAMLGLEIVKIVQGESPLILVKGSVPGKAGSLVFLRRAS